MTFLNPDSAVITIKFRVGNGLPISISTADSIARECQELYNNVSSVQPEYRPHIVGSLVTSISRVQRDK